MPFFTKKELLTLARHLPLLFIIPMPSVWAVDSIPMMSIMLVAAEMYISFRMHIFNIMVKMILDVSEEHLDLFKSLLKDADNDTSELFGTLVESFAFGILLKDKLESKNISINFSVSSKKLDNDSEIRPFQLLYNNDPSLSVLPVAVYKQVKIARQIFRNLEILYNTKQIRIDYFYSELNKYYNVAPDEFYCVVEDLKTERVITEVVDNVYQLV